LPISFPDEIGAIFNGFLHAVGILLFSALADRTSRQGEAKATTDGIEYSPSSLTYWRHKTENNWGFRAKSQ